jgi:hypothetical protein
MIPNLDTLSLVADVSTDILDIAKYLADLVPLRHHSPRLMEAVLYCWTD